MIDHMELHEIIRQRRSELDMSQSDLAAKVGVDKRQIRRYESGETQPTLPIAKAIARALGISIDELAGEQTHRVNLTGHWWASWQTSRSGTEKIATQEVEIKQEGSTLHIETVTRGLSVEEGGYHWSGELRLWDNEILMGWYAANDGSIRSKGTMYFVMHPHGLDMSGRWVGLGYDDQIMTGFASMAHSREESEQTLARLIHSGGEVARVTIE
jgi:transcriptional regulator with XRE-family HTH domain